jgi:hypothetical protein
LITIWKHITYLTASQVISLIIGAVFALALGAIALTEWIVPLMFTLFLPAARIPGVAGFVAGGILFPLFILAPVIPIVGLIYVLLRTLRDIAHDMQ